MSNSYVHEMAVGMILARSEKEIGALLWTCHLLYLSLLCMPSDLFCLGLFSLLNRLVSPNVCVTSKKPRTRGDKEMNSLLVLRKAWGMRAMRWGFFCPLSPSRPPLPPPALGPLIGKVDGSRGSGLTHINLHSDITGQTPQAAVFTGKTSTLLWVADTPLSKQFYYVLRR